MKERNRFTLGSAGPTALALLLVLAGSAYAAGAGVPAPSEEVVNQLESEVETLKKEVDQLKGEVTSLQQENAVKAPTEGAKAKTIGEHVGSLTEDLSNVKKDLSQNLGVHIHGLVDTTFDYNINKPKTSATTGGSNCCSTGGRLNQLRVFDVDANGFSLEQFNLHIDKTTEAGVGFVTDINFGQVANVLRLSTRSTNLNPGAVSNDVIDPTQMYLTYTAPVAKGINLSLGRFVTLLGEEIIPTWNASNFNITRSFLFGFAIPFTHTGMRAQYSFNDYAGLTLGVNNGWDDISDNNDGQTIEGQLALNSGSLMANKQSLALTISGIYGPEQVSRGNSHTGVIDPILTYHTSIPGLQLVGEYLYGETDGPSYVTPFVTAQGNSLSLLPPQASGTVAVNDPSWTGSAGYIVYDWTDNLELALRGEWFRDAKGARTGLRQTLGEVTGTINYKIPQVTGLLARFEYRHDESSAKPFFTNAGIRPSTGVPFHSVAGQDTLTASAVYSF